MVEKRGRLIITSAEKVHLFPVKLRWRLVRGCLPLKPGYINYPKRKLYSFSSLADIFITNHIQPCWKSFSPLFNRLTFTAIVGSSRKAHHPFRIFFLGDDFLVQLFSAKLPFRKELIQQKIMKLKRRLRISWFVGNGDYWKIVCVIFSDSSQYPNQKS